MLSTPRVLILGLNYSPETTGIAPYTRSVARGLLKLGMPLKVVTTFPHYPEWRFREEDAEWSRQETIEGVSVSRVRHYLPDKPVSVKRLLSEVSFGLRLLAVRWGRPDVVVMVSPALFSTAIAMLRLRFSWSRPRTVIWVQDLYSLGVTEIQTGGGAVARIIRWVESRTLRAASHVVVIHPRFARYVNQVLGVDAGRVEIVRNWTHLGSAPAVDVHATRQQLGWPTAESVVLHAGNMGAKQGLENVVDAARIAEEQGLPLRFVLLGDGNQRDVLESYGEGAARLQFLKSFDDVGFQSAMRSADILLVNEKPGVSEMAVPSKLTSYFSSGRPVVAATDPTGATAEEITAANAGLVVNAGDPQALLNACLKLRTDPQLAETLGANGQRYRAEVLSEEAAIERFAALIREEASLAHR